MSNNLNNRVLTNDSTCVHSASHTIRGAGQILVNTGGLQNAGTVVVDQSGSTLTIDPNARGLTNSGVLRAESGGILVLYQGQLTDAGGRIGALDTSAVRIRGATVVGGTLTTSGRIGGASGISARTAEGVGTSEIRSYVNYPVCPG